MSRTNEALAAAYRANPLSFLGSIGVHSIAIALLWFLPVDRNVVERPIYDQFIRPQAHKIIWYGLPKKLPDVEPPKKIGDSPTPRGNEVSKRAIIATAPKPESKNQIIWQRLPKLEIHQDIPAPNLIARAAITVPPPPPEAKPAPRPNPSPPEPKGDISHATAALNEGIPAPKPARAFVPPTPAAKPSRTPAQAPVLDAPAAQASILGAVRPRNILPEGLGAPTLAKAPPPANAPPGPIAARGNGNVDLASAGLKPVENAPVPAGSRAGGFSAAPTKGEAASGEGAGSGLTVPHLSITTSPAPPAVNLNRKPVLYADRVRSVPVSTLSVPLRPASRMIPRSIDARFQGRLVYTMVVPIENLPDYAGDWIIWFAERQQKPGDNPLVRAPIPFRKLEPVEAQPEKRAERRLQIAAVISKDGKVDDISVLRSVTPAIDKAVVQDLASWEFRSATRDGSPVDVDVVMEIPFNLPVEVAQRAQP